MEDSSLHDRLRDVVGNRSYRMLGEATGTSAETARRYLSGQAPSTEFLVRICERFGVNGEWLLTGRGPMHFKDTRTHALQQATAGELLHSLARAIEKLTDRVDRLELFVQTIEARVWSRLAAGGGAGAPGHNGNGYLQSGLIEQSNGAGHEPQGGTSQEDRSQARASELQAAGQGSANAEASFRPDHPTQPGACPSAPRPAPDVRLRLGRVAAALPQRPRADAP